MSERQRLINSFTTMGTLSQLPIPILTRYYLHILRKELDTSAKDMIVQYLVSTQETTGNPNLQETISNIIKDPTSSIHYEVSSTSSITLKHDSHDQLRMGSARYSEKLEHANACYKSLYLDDALAAYNDGLSEAKSRNSERFYIERCVINLVKENYIEALSLALKSKLDDSIFVSAISSGDFELAKRYIDPLASKIVKQYPTKLSFVTNFELTFLISFIIYATGTAKDAQDFSNQAYKINNFNTQTFNFVEKLVELNDLFCAHDFGKFLHKLKDTREILEFSIFTYPVVDQLISAIKKNVVRLTLFPLLKVKFSDISAQLGISEKEIVACVHQLIREGKLKGIMDLVENTYTSFIDLNPDREATKEYFERALIYRQNLKLNDWKNHLPK